MKMVSFNIPKELSKELKYRAVEEETTQTELLIKYIKQGLKEK